MNFVWDDAKNKTNIHKHGIDFVDIPPVFNRPMLVKLDEREQNGEDRWIGVGIFPNGIEVVVVFAESVDETIRLISARKATRKERMRYHEKNRY